MKDKIDESLLKKNKIIYTLNLQEKIDNIECRYCLSSDNQENMITPCNCEGSMRYVHQQCLEGWINKTNKKIVVIKENYNRLNILPCELCKYEIKFRKIPKNNVLISFYRMLSKILSSFKQTILLSTHFFGSFLILNRSRVALKKIPKKIAKIHIKFKYISFLHYFIFIICSGLSIENIYSHYKKVYLKERCFVSQFLPVKK